VAAAGGARQHVSVTGHDVAPAFSAIGLALLAMAVALLAARGPLRRIGGLIVVAIGAAALAGAFRAHNDIGHKLALRVFASSAQTVGGSRPAWWLLVVLGGVLAVVAGAAVTVGAGGRGGLDARHESPSTSSKGTSEPADAWEAIEQGQDPTVGQ
jgi:Tryptophan-associated transmembrane protein (Trp_oprn_chp)